MSIPTPGSDSQSLMSSGLEMLQAPQSLKDIVGFVKPYTPPEEPVDVEALMAERALLDQERFTQMLIDLGYMKPPAPEYIDNPLGMDIRPPSGLSGPSTDVMNPPKPSLTEMFMDFISPDDDFQIGGNTFSNGGLAGIEETIRDRYKKFGLGAALEEAYTLGVDAMTFLYDLMGVSGLYNQGGMVMGNFDVGMPAPDYGYLRYGDENAYLLGEMFGNEDPIYDYTLGMNLSDITPGLTMQLGVREDEIQRPRMSPDDEKFFKLLYNF